MNDGNVSELKSTISLADPWQTVYQQQDMQTQVVGWVRPEGRPPSKDREEIF